MVVELGHVRDALLGLSEDDLRDLVVVELDRERPTLRPAREAFAEAVTVALTPDGEGAPGSTTSTCPRRTCAQRSS